VPDPARRSPSRSIARKDGRMKLQLIVAAFAAIVLTGAGHPAATQTMDGAALFAQNCKTCHDPGIGQAPDRSELATRRPREIVAALTTGPMSMMQAFLNPAQIQAVATYLTTPTPAAARGRAPQAASPMPSEPAGVLPLDGK
jgi:mono/diheme cytochrome c family protein